jgi:hypothetical protein
MHQGVPVKNRRAINENGVVRRFGEKEGYIARVEVITNLDQ